MSRFHRPLALLPLAVLLAACQPAGNEAAIPPPAPVVDETIIAETGPIEATFRCGDLLVDTVFDNEAGNVTLSWSGNQLTLPQAMSASGARYADDAGNEFWNKGDSATLTFAGKDALECSTSEEVSPWAEARSRGVGFRGLGTEPFWSLEVDAGDNPQIRLDLDMGERKLVVAEASGTETGYAGAADDGSAVALLIRDGECSDGMSDQTYPASIELRVGEQVLKGCGAWLQH